MDRKRGRGPSDLLEGLGSFFRKCLFRILSMGAIPNHIAFIMDGNRRYTKKENLEEGDGHKAGFSALMSILKYCYELGVRYVTVYAFSIDNFKRKPDEVQSLMDLVQEKIEGLLEEQSVVNQYGVRVYFIGNLKLLSMPVRVAAEKVMKATANNTKCALLVCIAYTSCDEIVHAIEESCKVKMGKEQQPFNFCEVSNGEESQRNQQKHSRIKMVDIEKHMYMSVAPDPDILLRSSGETRLSNFLLWQTSTCPLYSPNALWPDIGLWHLVWAVLIFQRNYFYLEKKKKQL